LDKPDRGRRRADRFGGCHRASKPFGIHVGHMRCPWCAWGGLLWMADLRALIGTLPTRSGPSEMKLTSEVTQVGIEGAIGHPRSGADVTDIYVDMRSYRRIACSGCAFCAICAMVSLNSSEYIVSIFFTACALGSLYLALASGAYTISAQFLAYASKLGTWRISWDEISAAEYSAMGSLLLLGNNKRFALAPSAWWPRSGREEALLYVVEQMNARGIAKKISPTADYKWMKNTRV